MRFYQSRKSLTVSIVSALIAFFLIFVMAGNNRLKNSLNDFMSDSIMSRPYSELQTILPNYFSYLYNSAFWIESGNYPDPKNSNFNIELLDKELFKTLPGVFSINYFNNESGISFILEDDKVKSQNIESINNYYKNIYPIVDSDKDGKLYLTDLNILKSNNEKGFSIIYQLVNNPQYFISIDISVSMFKQYFKNIFSPNAILYTSFKYEEALTFPFDNKKNSEYYKSLTQYAIKESEDKLENRPFLIEYDQQIWFVLPYNLENYSGNIGLIIPESELFFSQFNQMYILASIPLLLLFLSLSSLFFIHRYRLNNRFTKDELLQKLINQGESSNLEFKSSLRWDIKEDKVNKKLEIVILKSIAAFANAYGGTLLIGVEDNGKILGLNNDYNTLKSTDKDGFELHLRNIVSGMYGTYAIKNLAVEFITNKGKEICKVTILKSSKPLFTIMKNKDGEKQENFYIRDGNLSRRLDTTSSILDYCNKRFSNKIILNQS
ncbi:MAG: ATP-binding protein [Spirochaetaceae bacterium]